MLKKIFIVFILLIISFFILKTYSNQNLVKNNIILDQKNYIVYYDYVKDSNIDEISKYDMAILEPLHVDSDQLKALNKANTISYAYQSIFEVELYNKEKIQLLKEEDYLYIDGIKQFNEKYKCYYGDIRSLNYKKILLDSIEKNVIKKGFDGVFFDTLDDIEHFIEEPVNGELYLEYIEFFKLLKSKYPKLSIIQNRAFDLYNSGSAEYLDGIMYEDLKFEKIKSSNSYTNLFNKLVETSKNNNVVVLAISHEDPIENYKLAKELKWLYFYNSPGNNYLKFEDNIYDINLN